MAAFSEDLIEKAKWFLSYAPGWPRKLLAERFQLTDTEAGELLRQVRGGADAAD